MNTVPVVVANVITLIPEHQAEVKGIKPGIFYTYYQTCTKDGYTYIYIDQVKRWYLKSHFKAHDIPVN